MRKALFGGFVLLATILMAAGLVYFWPIPTTQQMCQAPDWCLERGSDYYLGASTWETGGGTFFFVKTDPEWFAWDTLMLLGKRGFGPHAVIAAAYVAANTPPDGQAQTRRTTSYSTAWGRIMLSVVWFRDFPGEPAYLADFDLIFLRR